MGRRLPGTGENGSRNKAVNNLTQENGQQSLKTPESLNGTPSEGSEQATSTRKPDSEENRQMTSGNTEAYSTKGKPISEGNQENTNGNTELTKSNENSSGQTTQTKPNQNGERITNYPVRTDTTLQQPENHPGREDNEIPKHGNQYKLGQGGGSPVKGGSSVEAKTPVGEGSPVIEAPLQPKVHKIAPETRLPGEFTSQPGEEHNIILKAKQDMIRRPFSKLLDTHQRNEIRHLAKPKN
jgi:hypothetical protein